MCLCVELYEMLYARDVTREFSLSPVNGETIYLRLVYSFSIDQNATECFCHCVEFIK